MSNRLALCGSSIIFAILMSFVIWAERYHYQDCLRVGHTKKYCVLDIFR